MTFTLLDWFLVSANSNATPGDVPCTVTITAGTEEYPYELIEDIELNLTLSQYGFPVEDIVIKSSPVIADLDGNTLKDIYFGAENDKVYGYTIAGLVTTGFPFSTNDRVRSSPAVGDVDQDGIDELVFGNSSGKLHIVNGYGVAEHTFTQGGGIEGAPVLVDIDGDLDLEIIFTTVPSGNIQGGKLRVHVTNHNQTRAQSTAPSCALCFHKSIRQAALDFVLLHFLPEAQKRPNQLAARRFSQAFFDIYK